ncbi:hypothetical protein [Enterovirga aerilata]|uniref:Uncharacterized protein n=1 Tax=Enterovirga aerilata TaxID=2730920 RepID=A0A849I6U4_9HYPH|nr:hypothetical protein [Enterovirga sp. DB1703]NNM72129.1 hypothetical protein [Enterovirga sp. DB1703]
MCAALWAGSAEAQAPPPAPACTAIRDSAERIRCYEEDARFDFAAVVLRELECDAPPRAAELIRLLIRRNAASALAFHMAEGINYFALPRPERLGGITAVAVFAHDESGRFPFLRARGRSPGPVFGIVTRDGLDAVDAWRFRHSPALHFEKSLSTMEGAKDIGCFSLARPESQPQARPDAGPAAASPVPKPAQAEDLFEAGLGPKQRQAR